MEEVNAFKNDSTEGAWIRSLTSSPAHVSQCQDKGWGPEYESECPGKQFLQTRDLTLVFTLKCMDTNQRVHSINSMHKTCAFGNLLTIIMNLHALDIQNSESFYRD